MYVSTILPVISHFFGSYSVQLINLLRNRKTCRIKYQLDNNLLPKSGATCKDRNKKKF